jgi:hypothetical protein
MKKLTIALLVVAAAGALWRARTSDAPNPKLVFDRFWIDHEPKSATEKFKVFFVDGGEPFGRIVDRTWWTGVWEGFHYHVVPREPGVIDAYFGNTGDWQRLRYVARPCHENGFDFCLELEGNARGAHRYFSKKEWGAHAADLDRLAEQLAH